MKPTVFFTLLLACPGALLAHDGHVHTGLLGGLLHPLTGIDHLLAIVAIGWWAVHRDRTRWWVLPLAFISAMLVAAIAGSAGLVVGYADDGVIAGTLVVLGLVLSLNPSSNTLIRHCEACAAKCVSLANKYQRMPCPSVLP